MDVISSIVLGPQTELGRIQDPEFRNEFIEYLHSTFDMGWTATAFPNLTRLSLGMPEWLAERLLTVPIMEFKKASWDRRSFYAAFTDHEIGQGLSDGWKAEVIADSGNRNAPP